MKQSVLRNYARLIARMGVNVQKGQGVIIYCQLDQPKFVELLVDECYKAGAGYVKVEFSHQPIYKLHVRHQSVTGKSRRMGKSALPVLCGYAAMHHLPGLSGS